MWKIHQQNIVSNYKNREILNILHDFRPSGLLYLYNVQVISKIKNNIYLDIWYPIFTKCHNIDDINLDYFLKSIDCKNKNMIRLPIDRNNDGFILIGGGRLPFYFGLNLLINFSDEQRKSIIRSVKKNIILYYNKNTKSNIMEKKLFNIIFENINKHNSGIYKAYYFDTKLITFPVRKIYGNIEFVNYKLKNYNSILRFTHMLITMSFLGINIYKIFYPSSIGIALINIGYSIKNLVTFYKIKEINSRVSSLEIFNSIVLGISCIGINFFPGIFSEKNVLLSLCFSLFIETYPPKGFYEII